ncbi:eIF2 kinase Gcn2p negative regulator [Puccinia graminis f. sp. tritici]|uniref:eIF2 kinase Gcn2p negative regulator n=1 Tax=Puccinia graminis f. sp. tritici TaxID=56615 RepID=A0A5B0MZA6_PUCGR|nr:eIF2 kinase Gcn2p negative regulator [Puccinia graminis f. sp. tritici]KAA1131342.1 eIF2 kinase Gcn2p negative regulator [Puccinia graminis f. sp. tritici]
MPPPPRDSQEDPEGARIPVSFLVERLSESRAKLTDELSALEAILGEESFNCQFF